MTVSDRFSPGSSGPDASAYPTAFGVTFTPTVSGILIALAGLGLSGWMAFNLIGPKLSEMQELQSNIAQKQQKLDQQQKTVQDIQKIVARVNLAIDKNKQVRGLFSTQQALDTLLLDLNRIIVSSNAQLQKFTPDYGLSGVVADSSVGVELNNKIKRQVTDVSFEGTFNQTLAIMRTIDRFQTLLVLRDFKMELKPENTSTPGAAPTNLVTCSFKLYAYVPLTEEELAALQKQTAAASPAKPSGQAAPAQ
ncbi:YlbF family regulator [Altericista sp. CCNU0014]|uniref:YlbF family regulator n=1 Tax=Altericista sp. CCNU0014 TaxID=3082949 RepID=UPI00384C3450